MTFMSSRRRASTRPDAATELSAHSCSQDAAALLVAVCGGSQSHHTAASARGLEVQRSRRARTKFTMRLSSTSILGAESTIYVNISVAGVVQRPATKMTAASSAQPSKFSNSRGRSLHLFPPVSLESGNSKLQSSGTRMHEST